VQPGQRRTPSFSIVTSLQRRRRRFYYIMSSTWLLAVLLALAVASPTNAAFSPSHHVSHISRRASMSGGSSISTTQLAFGLPGFLTPKESNDDQESKKEKMKGVEKEKKIGLSGIVQLITAGAGKSPILGEFQCVEKEFLVSKPT
jgi:hypothetical protein